VSFTTASTLLLAASAIGADPVTRLEFPWSSQGRIEIPVQVDAVQASRTKTMTDQDAIRAASENIAAAIGRRDTAALRALMVPGFVHRTHGGAGTDLETFLTGVSQIPGEILAVRLEHLEIDLAETGALVTGIQYAQLRIDGQVVEDRRGFVDWFIKQAGEWRIQAAVDLPASP